MTLEERLCLARAGYSAQDIAQFEQGANFAKQEPENKPTEPAEKKESEAKTTVYEPTDPKELKEAMKKDFNDLIKTLKD